MKVREVMTRDPVVAEVPGTRDDVVRLFIRHDVSGLPVVRARTRELAGVVTRTDVFRNPEDEQLALIMTANPLTVSPEDDVSRAADLFARNRVHGLPVVEGIDVVGVVSPTDVLRVLGETNGRLVEEFMTRRAVPVHENAPLKFAWQVMKLLDQNALPVLDDDAGLVGIVADSDLFKLSDVEETIGVRELGLAPEEDEWAWENIRDIAPLYYATSRIDLPPRPVSEIMAREVVTVFSRSTIKDAAHKMIKHRVNQLPVVDTSDRLAGLITDFDLMPAYLEVAARKGRGAAAR